MRVLWRYWPLELVNRQGTPRHIVEVERPVAARLEPEAFGAWNREDYPVMLIPAMAAVKCAARQGAEAAERYDAALRRGFFREERNLSLSHELLDLAEQVGLDRERLEADFWSGLGFAAGWPDWQDSRRRPIQGSPHLFVLGSQQDVHNPGVRLPWNDAGLPLVAADDPQFLDRWLREALGA